MTDDIGTQSDDTEAEADTETKTGAEPKDDGAAGSPSGDTDEAGSDDTDG